MAELVEIGIERPKRDALPDLLAADAEWLDDCFRYHGTDMAKRNAIYEVNAAARQYAETILGYVMPSPDRSAALRAVREAKMWANAAIVLDGRR